MRGGGAWALAAAVTIGLGACSGAAIERGGPSAGFDPNGQVSCSGRPDILFPPSALSAPPLSPAELRADPAGMALVRFLGSSDGAGIYPNAGAEGWRVLARPAGRVLFSHGGQGGNWDALIAKTGSSWKWSSGGGCGAHHPGTTSWSYRQSASDPLLLELTYSAGRCGGHDEQVQQVYVDEQADQVTVAIVLAEEAGHGAGSSCAGVGITGHTVARLSRPLGTRAVIDGGPAPPRPVLAPGKF